MEQSRKDPNLDLNKTVDQCGRRMYNEIRFHLFLRFRDGNKHKVGLVIRESGCRDTCLQTHLSSYLRRREKTGSTGPFAIFSGDPVPRN